MKVSTLLLIITALILTLGALALVGCHGDDIARGYKPLLLTTVEGCRVYNVVDGRFYAGMVVVCDNGHVAAAR